MTVPLRGGIRVGGAAPVLLGARPAGSRAAVSRSAARLLGDGDGDVVGVGGGPQGDPGCRVVLGVLGGEVAVAARGAVGNGLAADLGGPREVPGHVGFLSLVGWGWCVPAAAVDA